MSFFQPKFAFFFMIFASGYMDLFKRFLVVGGYFNYFDLIFIVGMPSLCSIVCYASCAISHGLSPDKKPEDTRRLLISFALTSVMVVGLALSSGVGFRGAREAAFAAGFVPLIFVVPYLFPNLSDQKRILRLVVLVFIPVALYAIWQKIHGLSLFEIAYLETGLSGESRILSGQSYRLFSTLNSSQNLSKIMGMFAAICMLPVLVSSNRMNFVARLPWLGLGCLFWVAAYFSGSRTGLIMGVVLLVAFFVARSKVATVLAYAFGVFTFLTVLFSAQTILDKGLLGKTEGFLYSIAPFTRAENRVFVLGTLNVRFVSLSEIANGNRMYPFGAKLSGEGEIIGAYEVHDALSEALTKFGWVPLFFFGLILAWFLKKFHQTVWSFPKKSWERNVFILSFANFVAVAVGSIAATANFQTYPITYFLYLFVGISLVVYSRRTKVAQGLESFDEDSASESPMIPRLKSSSPV